jgi:hypothetical protein
MAAAMKISRAQLMYGLCLPLAAIIGFFLSDPTRLGSMAFLALLAGALVLPVFVRWYHPLLLISLHSAFVLAFLPGDLPLWLVIVFLCGLIVIFRRCLDPHFRLIPSAGVAWALIGMAIVVTVTALVRGGVGFRAAGSDSMGSKKYLYVLLGIAVYFVLASKSIPRRQAFMYMGLFCLPGLTSLLSHLIYIAGPKFYPLFNIIDSGPAQGQAVMDWNVQGNALFRSSSTVTVAGALISLMLACIGLRSALDLRKPWRIIFLIGCIAFGMMGGFRSFLVWTFLLLGALFLLEGLHRTRHMALTLAFGLVSMLVLGACSDRLPLSVQRTISFLPVQVDERVRQDAQGSLDWRLEMWDALKKDVPEYFLLGKGYAIDPGLMAMSRYNAYFGFELPSEWAILAGEYHNGPLSVAIPFGIWGMLAFGWFLVAGVLRLYWFFRHGDPELRNINRLLFATFATKIVFFLFFFGALNSDMMEFAALAGLAESLNAAPRESDQGSEEMLDGLTGEGMVE